MNQTAYHKFKDAEQLPVEAWEAILEQTVDPKERQHMQIAIAARKKIEEARGQAA